MNASSKLRIGCAVFACAVLSFPFSSHAQAGPSDQACESRPNDRVTKLGECIRPDALWDFMIAFEQIADRSPGPDGDASRNLGEPGYEASVAVKASRPLLSGGSDQKRQATNKFRQDREQLFENKRALPGPELRLGGPLTAAEEDYANRAYPGTDVPFTATLNAQAAFNQVRAHGDDNERNQWTLIGPSSGNFPNILTFSGANYITSGRITALALAPNCGEDDCSLYVGAAGGGIWRTDQALRTNRSRQWDYLSGSFGTNAIGTLIIDPTDSSGNTLYAGTGEPNASADSEAGVGIYKTTDGGNTWTKLADRVTAITTPGNGTYTGDAFAGRSIAGIVVDPTNPNVIYVASTRGVRGVSSVVSGGVTTNPPTPRPPFGLWKSTDGGATFRFMWDGNASIRGVINIALDPSNPSILYASAFDQGTWRSQDGGGSFTLIKAALVIAADPDRPSFAVTRLPNGKTRMYLGEGIAGNPPSRFFRTDDATAASPAFIDLTTTQNIGYCTGQCWYDNVVYSPPGKPDVVYLGGSFDYNNYGFINNGRAFIYSTDAGNTFTDMTWDATTTPTAPGSCCQPNATAPNGMHPDSHAMVAIPGTNAAFFGGDGGLMRSSGRFANTSSQCAGRGLTGTSLALCQQLLSRIPTHLYSLNDGLSTLQFQSVSVNPFDTDNLMGGTQDNGTFETDGSTTVWPQIIYGDGGQSGFNAANPALRFNSFTGQFNDVNFQNGDPAKWVIATGPIAASPEGSYFYTPIIPDPNPARSGTIFQGSNSVWRTQDWAGNQAFLEANCPEFTTSGANPACGDFVTIGPVNATDLTDSGIYGPAVYGPDRRGGFVAWIARTPSDTGTLWVATGTGRVFISKNADAAAASSVTYKRLDSLPGATAAPRRFVTGIYVDRANSNHAWISYSGYTFNTPSQPGHVFEVTYNGSNATWTRIDAGAGGLADLPITAVVRDDRTGDIFASSDFGVMRLRRGSTKWAVAGSGLPMVEVIGLTISTSGHRLFAATHGRSVWSLRLSGEDER
jgi:hypothetical protein